MNDGNDSERDYLLVIRGYGRLLLKLGIVALAVGVILLVDKPQAAGRAMIVAGAVGVLAGAHLLQGAHRR